MNSEAILDLFRIIVLIFVLIGCIRLIFVKKNRAFVVSFTLGIACILLSDFYWLVYDIVRPNSRMPFAANEICEWALFMLLGSALSSQYPKEKIPCKKELFAVILFVIGNVALWIGWSGEWIQDILTGVSLLYFLCALVYRIKIDGVLDKGKGILLGIVGFVLILGQACTFLVPGNVRKILDIACYIFMFATLAILILITIIFLRKKEASEAMCFSLISFAWCVTTLYMSSAEFYLAAMMLSAICFILMYAALKREVMAE